MIKLGVKQNEQVEIPQVEKQMERQLDLTNLKEMDEVAFQNLDQTLPKSHLYKRLKKLSSFKEIKKNYKMEHQKGVFVTDLKELFKHLNQSDHKFDTDLLVELLNACEDYFIYGNVEERENSKKTVITELMLPFFESEEILEKFIVAVSHKVKKSTLLKRVLKRMKNFFF